MPGLSTRLKRVLAYAAFTLPFAGMAHATEYVVKIKGTASFASAAASLKKMQTVKLLDTHTQGRLVLVNIPAGVDEANLLATLLQQKNVEYVVPNVKFHALDMVNDPRSVEQWSLAKVDAAGAWAVQRGSQKIVVAVIDTGVDFSHEDLKSQMWNNQKEAAGNGKDDDANGFVDDVRGWDFHDNNNNPMDQTSAQNPGHGTHCAGIVGAASNNGVGGAGMAPVVSIMPVRFLGSDGSGDLMAAAKAIDYAVNNGANIISASWGAAIARSSVTPILEAIQRAGAKNVVFVAAAANDGLSNDTREVYPANAGLPNVISVAASDNQDQKPSWSNFGVANVDLASPGANILSSLPGNKYGNLSGTSMATPMVAGLAALVLAEGMATGRNLAPQDVKSILQATGAKVDIETACHCRIEAAKAVESVRDNALTIVPNGLTLKPTDANTFAAIGGKAPYKFSVANADIATISDDGKLTAVKDGQTVVSVEDANGLKAQSQTIYVAQSSGGGDEPGGGGDGQCPFPVPQLCDILCQIAPQMPWCKTDFEL